MRPVDTNILFPLLVEGPRSAEIRVLRTMDAEWRTEPFAMVELSHILTKYVRNRLITIQQAEEYFAKAEELFTPLLVPVSNKDAFVCSLRYGISAYDARFIAVAEVLGVPLITEDARLRKAASHLTQSLDKALLAAV